MHKLSQQFPSRQLLLVYASLFVVSLGFGVILPILPFYTERLALGEGASQDNITFHIGFLTSAYPFFQMFLAPVWGKWSDRLGRKPLIFVGLLGFAVMQFLIGISTSLWMLYLARIIGGIFTSAILPVSYAYVSDLTSESKRFSGIAFAGAASSLGVVLGPSLGGILSQADLHVSWRFGHFLINDYSTPFFFLALLGLLALPVTMIGLKQVENRTENKPGQDSIGMWKHVIRLLFPLLLLSFFYQAALTLFESVFSIYAKNVLQYDAITIGIAFMICASVMGLLQPFAASNRFKKIISNHKQVVFGFGLFGFGMLFFLLSDNILWTMSMVALLATGGAFITPNITAFISLKSEQMTGTALGIQNSANSFGQVLGPIIGSWLFTLNVGLPFLAAGGLILGVTLLLYRSKSFMPKKIPA